MMKNVMEMFKEKAEECLQNGDEVTVSIDNPVAHIMTTIIPDRFDTDMGVWISSDNYECVVKDGYEMEYNELDDEFAIYSTAGNVFFNFH